MKVLRQRPFRVAAALAGLVIAILAVTFFLPYVFGPRLLTGGKGGCALLWTNWRLVADPEYGTVAEQRGYTVPVRWPGFYRARAAGAEIEVLNPLGMVVAVTGRDYLMDGTPMATDDFPAVVLDSCGEPRPPAG